MYSQFGLTETMRDNRAVETLFIHLVEITYNLNDIALAVSIH